MSEIETSQDMIDQIIELDEIIAYGVETGGSATCQTEGGCSGTVYVKTFW